MSFTLHIIRIITPVLLRYCVTIFSRIQSLYFIIYDVIYYYYIAVVQMQHIQIL